MKLNCADINELIKEYLFMLRENDRLANKIRSLEMITQYQKEEIETLKQVLGVKKEDKEAKYGST